MVAVSAPVALGPKFHVTSEARLWVISIAENLIEDPLG